jgi:hypothetical protein
MANKNPDKSRILRIVFFKEDLHGVWAVSAIDTRWIAFVPGNSLDVPIPHPDRLMLKVSSSRRTP